MYNFIKLTLTSLTLAASLAVHAKDNSFFNGYINSCTHSQQFETFLKDMCVIDFDKDGQSFCKSSQVSVPAGMTALIKRTEKSDHTLMEATFNQKQKFAGNQVLGVENWVAHDNGIRINALILEETDLAKAQAKMKNSGVVLKKRSDGRGFFLQALLVQDDDKRIKVLCDTSD